MKIKKIMESEIGRGLLIATVSGILFFLGAILIGSISDTINNGYLEYYNIYLNFKIPFSFSFSTIANSVCLILVLISAGIIFLFINQVTLERYIPWFVKKFYNSKKMRIKKILLILSRFFICGIICYLLISILLLLVFSLFAMNYRYDFAKMLIEYFHLIVQRSYSLSFFVIFTVFYIFRNIALRKAKEEIDSKKDNKQDEERNIDKYLSYLIYTIIVIVIIYGVLIINIFKVVGNFTAAITSNYSIFEKTSITAETSDIYIVIMRIESSEYLCLELTKEIVDEKIVLSIPQDPNYFIGEISDYKLNNMNGLSIHKNN